MARATALGDVIRAFPARSLADLRHKLIYFRPDMMDVLRDVEAQASLVSIENDVLRLTNEAVPTELDFTPCDINGPCPIATRAQWIEEADTLLPWLRMGFLMLTLDRRALETHLGDLDDKTFDDLTYSLGVASRNFDQLRRFVVLVQQPMEAALSAAVEEHGPDAPCGPAAGERARG